MNALLVGINHLNGMFADGPTQTTVEYDNFIYLCMRARAQRLFVASQFVENRLFVDFHGNNK